VHRIARQLLASAVVCHIKYRTAMKIKTSFLITFLLLFNTVFGQKEPIINITFSKLLATYDFIQKLSDNYPDNEYKQTFQSSEFSTQHYSELVNQLDTLNIYESYDFQGYPTGQKIPFTTTFLIKKNLINSLSIQEFKKQTFGIIPNTELFAFSYILSEFEPIYDSLIYNPNKDNFEKQLNELKDFVQKSNLSDYFQTGLTFYGSPWDYSIPIDIAIIPSIKKRGFTATAFLNNAVSEVPIDFKGNDILFSVLMHEIYHNIYDGQPLELKQKIQFWFKNNNSQNSQYALLLLNEALATALGNGYVYEQLNGKPDESDWYNMKYINLMAKQMYPLVKEYISQKKSMDENFVDQYIALYDNHFSDWINELDNLFSNRFVIADNREELSFFNKNYRPAGFVSSMTPVNQNSLERMKETPYTKVIVISSDHNNTLNLIKTIFPELKEWKYKVKNEFVYTTDLQDKTKLIIVNKHSSTLDELFDKNLKNGRIK
jgi:hypothetical protein